MSVTLSLCEVETLAQNALRACGAGARAAQVMALSIRDAEAEGIRNVGLGFLPVYCEQLRAGKVRGDAEPVVSQPAAAVLRVDAGDGFCHPAFVAAEERFVALARTTGIAALAVVRSSAAGVVGWFNLRLARAGLVSLAFANASPLVAPHGGRERFFGTNPLAAGAPRAGTEPLVIDLSTSATAYANVLAAARRGEPIPVGWALDAAGRPTTDADAAVEGGSVAPLGGYKGTALAIMVDLLAAGVTGAAFSSEMPSMFDDRGGPVGAGQLFIAMDPGLLGGERCAERLDAMLADMCRQEGVRVPGDRRHHHRCRAERSGVGLDEALYRALLDYAGRT